ncbi:MAG: PIN domain-containing protein [Gemmataceae bacterium]
MTFVDSSGWFALYVMKDPNHAEACQWMLENRSILLTTDYVIDETLTLLRARGQRSIALEFGRDMFELGAAKVHFVGKPEATAALAIFQVFDDKDWSFTDCTSKVVIDQLGIRTAFAFDHHFRQFGTVAVVP